MSAVDIISMCPKRFAATGCLVCNETTSAARLSAEHAEEAAATADPADRFVFYVCVVFSCHKA